MAYAYGNTPPVGGAGYGAAPPSGYGPGAGGYGGPPGGGYPGGGQGYAGAAGGGFPQGPGYGASPVGSYAPGIAGGGGYGPGAPPAASNPQLWQWFSTADRDNSGQITAEELKQCLLNGDQTNFDLDTVKMLMAIFDTDRTGTIGFKEFEGVWNYIREWQEMFRRFDKDRSGNIDNRELEDALRNFGYTLTPQLLQLVFQKFATGGGSSRYPGRGQPPAITFDRFVRACVTIKSLTESFKRLDNRSLGYVQFDYDTFMRTVLSAP